MKHLKIVLQRLQNIMGIFKNTHRVYKKLQKHLNKQAVGLPASITGVERRLLRSCFTVDEAKIALFMSYKAQSADDLLKKVDHLVTSKEQLLARLENMEKNAALIVTTVNGQKRYALAPLLVAGMLDMRVNFFDADFFLDVRSYVTQAFGVEFLSASAPQLRTIPVQKSISPDTQISTFDEARQRISEHEGHISVAPCVCKLGMDNLGRPCKVTDRRELCLQLGGFADQYIRNGFGRAISKEEALAVLAENEKDGLVLQTSNSKEALYICSCCKCCCGPIEIMSLLARPAEYMRNNFYAVIEADKCTGCGTCAQTCQMDAVVMKNNKTVRIDTNRCLGCGNCVSRCPSGALSLRKKSTEYTPPETMEALYDEICEGKKGGVGRWVTAARRVIGL